MNKKEQQSPLNEEDLSSDQETAPAVGEYPAPEIMLERYMEAGLTMHAEAYKKVLELCSLVKSAGGRALLVGGCVRDHFFNKLAKDFDVEIYGLEPDIIEDLIKNIGKVSVVGRAFGILKISLPSGLDIDVSLPRTDSKIGAGHRGFEVKTDPHMSIKEAARRRDFTMNALSSDPLTGKVYDYFNGLEDIKNRCLRVTDEEKFKDDPLRVLRALQFVGRFSLMIDPKSMDLMREIVPQIKELPKERIEIEWRKLLIKSEQPSLGLSAGMILGVFHELHPELVAIEQTPQEEKWHPEGSVWNHTLLSVDQAAKIIEREQLTEDMALVIVAATLCHDLGKPAVTKTVDGVIKSLGHEKAGEEPTKKFLSDIGFSGFVRDKVVKLVANHMVPTTFYANYLQGKGVSDGAIRRLAERIHPSSIYELVLVSEADYLGRGFFSPESREQMLMPSDNYLAGPYLLKRARDLEVELSRPVSLTRGRDWITLGFKAGKDIGELIHLADRCRDELNLTREQVLSLVYNCEIIRSADERENSVEYRDVNQAIKILQEKLEEGREEKEIVKQ